MSIDLSKIFFFSVQDLRYQEDTPMPVINHPNEVIVKVKAVGICGSDISRFNKLGPYVEGMTFGHEFSGEVIVVGEQVSTFKVGDRVTACPTLICGGCESCLKGKPSQCNNLTVIGARHPGAYAEYVKLPSQQIVHIPDNVDFETAALIEPSSVVAHGFYRTNLQPGGTVAIMGCGSIGLLAIQWSKIFGAETIIAIDIDDEKLRVAEKLGANVLINSLHDPPHKKVLAYTLGRGVDLAIESAGSPITSSQVFALSKKGGEVVFLGIPYGDVTVKRFYFEKIVRNELTILGSWNAISSQFPGKEWTASIHFMGTDQIDVKPMISHRLSLKDGPDIFNKIINREEQPIKVLFLPEM